MSDSLNVYKNCSLVVIQMLMLVKDQRLHLMETHFKCKSYRISELSESFVIVYLCAYF